MAEAEVLFNETGNWLIFPRNAEMMILLTEFFMEFEKKNGDKSIWMKVTQDFVKQQFYVRFFLNEKDVCKSAMEYINSNFTNGKVDS